MPFSIDISPLRGGKVETENLIEIRRNPQAKTPRSVSSNLSYCSINRTVPEKVSSGASTITPAGTPRASRLIASVGHV